MSAKLVSLPPEVKELRNDWPSLQDVIPGLTHELEKDFRFSLRVSKTKRGYFLGGTMKGGSSSMWHPSGPEAYRAYVKSRNIEGFQEGNDRRGYERMRALLKEHGIDLRTIRSRLAPDVNDFVPSYSGIYGLVDAILRVLPLTHLERREFSILQLGGWGPDSAKASAFKDNAILMYDFAIQGARRTFIGLFLHELGHAHEHALPEAAKSSLIAYYRVLARESAFMGIEFLCDRNIRKLYQKFVFNEFLAETYLHYVSCGQAFRDFIEAQEPPLQRAWQMVYKIFKESFEGWEYE